ncbi:2-oxoacid:acceptor oxidoreductase family protein [Candidatus Micrarchaeota archaeon]|nr:2-oxoacid:acceptor oxidoreductase family protein [Candidatus Micrarchaeota archaeon]
MYRIRMHSRGGQGGKTAAKMLADAFFNEGKQVQAFSVYGAERRGAPVVSFVRVDDKPILERGYINDPECIVVMDDSLLKSVDELGLYKGLDPKEFLIINTRQKMKPPKKGVKLITVDATAIARETMGREVFNTAMLGAFAAATGRVSLASLEKAIHDNLYRKYPDWIPKNIAAIKKTYEAVKGLK